jgi:hypothetical protein
MKIRSITVFLDPGWPLDESRLAQAGEFIAAARPDFESIGYEVQTARLATPPFAVILPTVTADSLTEFALALERAGAEHGFQYNALGPAQLANPGHYPLLPQVLARTRSTFFSAEMAVAGQVDLAAVRACARIIHDLAPLDPNGFANLYFTALANVAPGSPFFPAAYHAGDGLRFALATESADLAVSAFQQANSLTEAINNLVHAIQTHAGALNAIAHSLASKFPVEFGGIDFSLAAFPEESRSLGTAFERLGIPRVGQHGSLAAAALIANALDTAVFERVGFSGLMLPVLEDYTLARRAAEGVLTVKDMLMFSAVCGTGLDTLPLPGAASVEAIAALLLDLAALSSRLAKPLTARLMPVPGKQAGQLTTFDFDFFANSRVLALDDAPLTGHLAGDETFQLNPRGSKN